MICLLPIMVIKVFCTFIGSCVENEDTGIAVSVRQ